MKPTNQILACLSLYFARSMANVCETNHTNYCGSLVEHNYFDSSCYTDNKTHNYGDLGCNAGGLLCCRFCEFGLYENITCINQPPAPPMPPAPNAPPHSPRPCSTVPAKSCDSLVESNYFDITCHAHDDMYGGLGCNAGGLKCCRFCGFGNYKKISCFKSPAPPPAPPRNPLIMPIEDIYIPPKKSKIEFNIRINSEIEVFDKMRFKRKLRKVFNEKISYEHIILRVRPGSVIIDVILLTNASIADNTTSIIDNMTPATLGVALNETVIELSSPIVVNNDQDENLNAPTYSMFPLFMLSMTATLCMSICLCCYYGKIKRLTTRTRTMNINIKKSKLNDIKELPGMSSLLTNETDDIFISKQQV